MKKYEKYIKVAKYLRMSFFLVCCNVEGTDTASRPTSKLLSHVGAHSQVFYYKNTNKFNFYFKILVYVKLLL